MGSSGSRFERRKAAAIARRARRPRGGWRDILRLGGDLGFGCVAVLAALALLAAAVSVLVHLSQPDTRPARPPTPPQRQHEMDMGAARGPG